MNSPIDDARQRTLNMNFAKTKAFKPGLIQDMIQEQKAILNSAAVPIPQIKERLVANLKLSQYRNHVNDLVDGLSTFLAYPVFDTLDKVNRQVVGVVASNIYWEMLFSDLLPATSKGIICVIENSFQQTFTYRIEGPKATLVGMGDFHNPIYDDMELHVNLIDYLRNQAGPENSAYSSVLLSNATDYTLRVYPSEQTEALFVTDSPITFACTIFACFVFAAIVFGIFSRGVEKRQGIMMGKVIENAQKAADAERELNGKKTQKIISLVIFEGLMSCQCSQPSHKYSTPLLFRIPLPRSTQSSKCSNQRCFLCHDSHP